MKKIPFILFLVAIQCNAIFGQDLLPKLTSSSRVTNLAIYNGDVVLVVPVDEYRLTNQKIQSLINIIYSLDEVDSIKTLQIHQMKRVDSVRVVQIDSLATIIRVLDGNISDLKKSVLKHRKWKRIGWSVAGLYLINTARKIYILISDL